VRESSSLPENARSDNTVAAKDVKRIQDTPDNLIHALIHHDDQEEAHDDSKPYHALVVGAGLTSPSQGSAVIAVSGWAGQVPQVACLQEGNLNIQG
jgi:hypothetical protein